MNSQDWLEITQLLSRYAQIQDSGRREGLADCFTEDAVLDTPHRDRHDSTFPVRGRNAIADALHERQRAHQGPHRVHLVANTVITKETDESVELTSSMVVVESRDGAYSVAFVGAYDDTVVKESDGRWRLSRKVGRIETGLPPKT